jgi:hypothetical protein
MPRRLGHTYLIRPDAYVMASSKEGDVATILHALGQIATLKAPEGMA